jgi:hypothetical protein
VWIILALGSGKLEEKQARELLRNPFGIRRVAACVGGSSKHDVRVIRKRWFWVIFAVGVLAVGVLAVATREWEPEYGGKKLSEWVLTRPWWSQEARVAIRQIGAEAVPYLVKWMRYEPAAWKRKLFSAVNPMIKRLKPSWQFNDVRQEQLADGATHALVDLAEDRYIQKVTSEAERVIPELTRVLNDRSASTSAQRAAYAMSCLGSAGLPPLLGALTNRRESQLRLYIFDRIGEMGTNARPAIPCLLTMRADADPNVRYATTAALRKIDPHGAELGWLRLEKTGNNGEERITP